MLVSTRIEIMIIVLAVLQVSGLVLALVVGHTTVGHVVAGLVAVSLPIPVQLYRAYRHAKSAE